MRPPSAKPSQRSTGSIPLSGDSLTPPLFCYNNDAWHAQDERNCPNCGDGFTPKRADQRFCTRNCTRSFHNRALSEGMSAIKLVKAWIETRHAKKGTREYELCRTARRELTQLAELLIARDKAMGRPPAHEYVAGRVTEGVYYMDAFQRFMVAAKG